MTMNVGYPKNVASGASPHTPPTLYEPFGLIADDAATPPYTPPRAQPPARAATPRRSPTNMHRFPCHRGHRRPRSLGPRCRASSATAPRSLYSARPNTQQRTGHHRLCIRMPSPSNQSLPRQRARLRSSSSPFSAIVAKAADVDSACARRLHPPHDHVRPTASAPRSRCLRGPRPAGHRRLQRTLHLKALISTYRDFIAQYIRRSM
ncbi:hypothetical protein HYPSUDRAFT_197829 [Hypholoma sublateritium FD-334 SS-4]|uniref:Uncharacterized protein n=1 Tax=Hypholoma sublateritium (strain FD-334 SS-4) TaxID=945553 RepID=A0A0D2LJ34_HYPSF|nr:hypothetical protein HYPSUDRAFT_197829 [Hypholoma sublateritium FD-334 SS-4]